MSPIEHGFWDAIPDQEHREKLESIYSRLVLFRKGESGVELLMQKHKNGELIFPGGRCEEKDGDTIETLVRELNEETFIDNDYLRNLGNRGLLYYSRLYKLDWGTNLENRDAYWVLEWDPKDANNPLGDIKDSEEELNWIGWVPIDALVKGEKKLHQNTLDACAQLQPIIENWTDPLEEITFEIPEEFRS